MYIHAYAQHMCGIAKLCFASKTPLRKKFKENRRSRAKYARQTMGKIDADGQTKNCSANQRRVELFRNFCTDRNLEKMICLQKSFF